jgi:hypothetical protein
MMAIAIRQGRWAVPLASLALALAGCGRGASHAPAAQAADGTRPDAGERLEGESAPAEPPSADDGGSRWTGIRGRVKVLEGSPGGEVLIALPNDAAGPTRVAVGDDGRFAAAGLAAATYRLVVPADGVHSTAELYVAVDRDTGQAETTIHRSRGCPVKIAVRDQSGAAMSGAQLELALTDLPLVPEPHRVAGTTDGEGRLVVVGSCVRGSLKGTLRVPGRGVYAIDHGYVGSGWDRFDVVVPDVADAGVAYANDE